MQTTKFIFAIALFTSSTLLNAQIKVINNGNVGVGTLNPSSENEITIEGDNILFRSKANNYVGFKINYQTDDERIDFCPANYSGAYYTIGYYNTIDWLAAYEGSFYDLNCISFTTYSDKQLKKNINSMIYNREAFQKLNPVSFVISDSLLMNENNKKAGKKPTNITEYGFVAQELQKSYPQLVTKDEKTGFLKIKSLELIPILVSAIKDQQTQISDLETRISKLENSESLSVKKVGLNTSNEKTDILTYPVLDQNVPNPFNTSTTISYYLPVTIINASIYIYDMNGVQLKSYSITEREKSMITIQGSELNEGMYLYALIADGKVIDTKRMILTKEPI